ncbi:techylectin-5A [Trichonephila clavata]|uniref:Techylectin-5A n=1 Tax=Trichonephila clavata TaxID=2740835 RepID=A0A8X6G5I7_TRICU|nr:techylectin-5A [Trichonephila clavata]
MFKGIVRLIVRLDEDISFSFSIKVEDRIPYSKMISGFALLLILVDISQGHLYPTPECDNTGNVKSYLEIALEMIIKAKTNFPVCPPDARSKPVDCEELLGSGRNKSGVYTVWSRNRVTEGRPVEVFCDMDTDGGGWTVIQRRGNYSRPEDYFFKDWESYKKGFGDIEKDFWLGNDNIFALTNQRLYSIRFDLQAVDGVRRYALYDTFWIDDENNKYTLRINGYSGNAGDSMTRKHNNQKFSTKDQDNDSYKESCALHYKGGWWYDACHDANLNGLYLNGTHKSFANGINWDTFRGKYESLTGTEMKIRPKNFRKKRAL